MGSLEDLQKGDPEDFWAVAECPRLSRSPLFGRQLSGSRPQVLPTCTISTCSKRMTTNVPCAWQPSDGAQPAVQGKFSLPSGELT